MSESKIYPLTVALLISIALRVDHAFGMPEGLGFAIEPIGQRQREGLYQAYCIYQKELAGRLEKSSSITERQAREEIIGQGFYKPTSEAFYLGFLDPSAKDYAQGLVGSNNEA